MKNVTDVKHMSLRESHFNKPAYKSVPLMGVPITQDWLTCLSGTSLILNGQVQNRIMSGGKCREGMLQKENRKQQKQKTTDHKKQTKEKLLQKDNSLALEPTCKNDQHCPNWGFWNKPNQKKNLSRLHIIYFNRHLIVLSSERNKPNQTKLQSREYNQCIQFF